MKKEKIKIVRGKLKPRKSNAPPAHPRKSDRWFVKRGCFRTKTIDYVVITDVMMLTQQPALGKSIELINLDRAWSITLIHD